MDNESRISQLLHLFQNTFTDLQFNGSDKKAIKDLIKEIGIEKREKDLIRSKLFDLARERFEAENHKSVLTWLEEANKSLFTKQDKQGDNDVYFSPGDECMQAIVSRLTLATSNIKACVFTISDDRIANALIQAHEFGTSVKIITDNDKLFDEGSDIRRMAELGIEIKIDNTPSHMHHKFAVIDHKIVLTGSYNWTRSAAHSNQENLLVTDVKHIVASYEREFDRLWEQMEDFIA
jgi:phosphatidylserine/phosphatidylglycerophosphate/cardiolipin synthase-like enzyme